MPSEENATACGAWVWITALRSERARRTSEWMNTSLWRGIEPPTRWPSRSTVMMFCGVISSRPMVAGFIRKRLLSSVEPHGHVPGDEIALVLHRQDTPGIGEFSPERLGHRFVSFVVSARMCRTRMCRTRLTMQDREPPGLNGRPGSGRLAPWGRYGVEDRPR